MEIGGEPIGLLSQHHIEIYCKSSNANRRFWAHMQANNDDEKLDDVRGNLAKINLQEFIHKYLF